MRSQTYWSPEVGEGLLVGKPRPASFNAVSVNGFIGEAYEHTCQAYVMLLYWLDSQAFEVNNLGALTPLATGHELKAWSATHNGHILET